MSITAERRTVLIGEYANAPADTGSPEVQVALLSEQGFPQPPRPADAGRPPPPAARLPQGEEQRPLSGPDRPAEPSPLAGFAAVHPHIGRSGAYPRTMVVRGNAVRACVAPERRGHAADRQTAVPATRGAGLATAFPATWPAAAPALTANAARAIHATRDAASRPVGPRERPACRPPMPRI